MDSMVANGKKHNRLTYAPELSTGWVNRSTHGLGWVEIYFISGGLGWVVGPKRKKPKN